MPAVIYKDEELKRVMVLEAEPNNGYPPDTAFKIPERL